MCYYVIIVYLVQAAYSFVLFSFFLHSIHAMFHVCKSNTFLNTLAYEHRWFCWSRFLFFSLFLLIFGFECGSFFVDLCFKWNFCQCWPLLISKSANILQPVHDLSANCEPRSYVGFIIINKHFFWLHFSRFVISWLSFHILFHLLAVTV